MRRLAPILALAVLLPGALLGSSSDSVGELRYAGRPLAEALEDLRDRGLRLIYGSNPEAHTELLGAVGMPDEKGPNCQFDYAQTARSWSRVLGGYLKN